MESIMPEKLENGNNEKWKNLPTYETNMLEEAFPDKNE